MVLASLVCPSMVSFGLRGLFLCFFLQNKWLFMCWSVVLFKEWDHFFLKIQVFWSTDIFSSGGAKVKWLDDVTLYKQPMNKNKNLASRMHLFCYKSSLITYIVARSGKEWKGENFSRVSPHHGGNTSSKHLILYFTTTNSEIMDTNYRFFYRRICPICILLQSK